MPLVTVITTFYNAEQTIEAAVESVLSQTFEDFEYILIDDGSSDRSNSIIKTFKDSRIRLIGPERLGRVKSLNLALENAKGDYICILDADDISYRERIEKQLAVFKENENLALVFGNASLIDEDSNVVGKTLFPIDHDSVEKSLLSLNPFPHSSVMFNREIILSIGGYNEKCLKSIDFNLYIELLINKKMLLGISEPLIYLRESPNTWGKSDDSATQIFFGILALLSLYFFRKTGKNILRSSDHEWQEILSAYTNWFRMKRFKDKSNAKKTFYASRYSRKRGEILRAIKFLFISLSTDPFFWTYRGVNFRFEDASEEFFHLYNSELFRILKLK